MQEIRSVTDNTKIQMSKKKKVASTIFCFLSNTFPLFLKIQLKYFKGKMLHILMHMIILGRTENWL